MILLPDVKCVASDTENDMAVGRRLARDGFFGHAVFLTLPPHFVTRPRLIFARVQDGASIANFALKTPTNCLLPLEENR